jgi:small conductance mechanosensitive channel
MPQPYLTVIEIGALVVVAALVARIAHSVSQRLLARLDIVSSADRAAVHARAARVVRALTLLAYGVAAVAGISLALTRLGLAEARWDARALGGWVATHGVNVLVIALGAVIAIRAANVAIEHLQHKLRASHAGADLEWERRASTLAGILTSLVTAIVAFAALLMLLREVGIDVVPILTGAGIAGLAIGFGAQNLVRDVISGFFIILEDQIRGRRSRAHQQRHRHGGTDQPPHDRPARRRWGGPGVPERIDHGARKPEQAVRLRSR